MHVFATESDLEDLGKVIQEFNYSTGTNFRTKNKNKKKELFVFKTLPTDKIATKSSAEECIVYWILIQEKLTPSKLLFSVFAGWDGFIN